MSFFETFEHVNIVLFLTLVAVGLILGSFRASVARVAGHTVIALLFLALLYLIGEAIPEARHITFLVIAYIAGMLVAYLTPKLFRFTG